MRWFVGTKGMRSEYDELGECYEFGTSALLTFIFDKTFSKTFIFDKTIRGN